MIQYQREDNISLQEFKSILVNSTLGERRPIDEDDRLSKMIEHGNLIVTAREDGLLVGIARSITDFVYCTYLSDLAVDERHQKKGIGKELIRRTKLEAPQALLILLSAPAAVDYYPKIGMDNFDKCFLLKNVNRLR